VSAPFAEVQRRAEAAIAVWGRVDVVVNNAGTVGREFGPSEELGCVALRPRLRFLFYAALSFSFLLAGNPSTSQLLCVEMNCSIETELSFFYFVEIKARGHGGSL